MQYTEIFAKESDTSSFIQDVLSLSEDQTCAHIFDATTPSSFDIEKIPQTLAPIVIWDLDCFPKNNFQVLEAIRNKHPDVQILAYAENPINFAAIPQNLYDTLLSVESVKVDLMTKIAKLKEIHNARKIFSERMSHLVGNSPAMKKLRHTVERAILHSGPVLIQGETGVGKELFAKAVACSYNKFVTVNCSAIPENLIESELFGYVRGAFTGAQKDHIGLFESADGGAIFLDEIGDMPLSAQVKLLRVLQNKEIRPLGASKTTHINVRVIAATNRDLAQEVREKRFREDLYYRLNVIPLKISPLRERKEDISDLAHYFIKIYQKPGEYFQLSSAALQKLQQHHWPGNIRELENVIQRALCFSDDNLLEPKDIQIDNSELDFATPKTTLNITEAPAVAEPSYKDFCKMQQEQERDFLVAAIQNCGSARKAAEKLGMGRTFLYNRLGRLGVNIKDIKQ